MDRPFFGPFEEEFRDLSEKVQDELLACALLLQKYGPKLGRPRVDALSGSDFANMKELRFDAADGAWHLLLIPGGGDSAVAGDKSGGPKRSSISAC